MNLKVESELAEQRYQDSLPKEGQKGFQPVLASNEANIKPDYHETKATAQTAKKVGVKRSTYEHAKE